MRHFEIRFSAIRRFTFLLFILMNVIACGVDSRTGSVQEIPTPAYTIDTSRITVSGMSSGGYMAGQLHMSHSDLFSGVAILAGGPYWCAEGSLSKGLGPCLKGSDIDPVRLLRYAEEMSTTGKIDALANLFDDTVWLFHGANDAAVDKKVVTEAAAFYAQLVSADKITTVMDVPAAHGMPTLSVGAACDAMVSPFLNACGYDAAGELLSALNGPMHERVTASGELRTVVQPDADSAEMLKQAFLYVPKNCASGERCGLHVALHGCQQSSEFVNDAFATGAGYNEWAESNNLLVLYPQVASSKLAPMNPMGCWDWWGYTNKDYATRSAPQIVVIKSMIDTLTKVAAK